MAQMRASAARTSGAVTEPCFPAAVRATDRNHHHRHPLGRHRSGPHHHLGRALRQVVQGQPGEVCRLGDRGRVRAPAPAAREPQLLPRGAGARAPCFLYRTGTPLGVLRAPTPAAPPAAASAAKASRHAAAASAAPPPDLQRAGHAALHGGRGEGDRACRGPRDGGDGGSPLKCRAVMIRLESQTESLEALRGSTDNLT